MTDLKILVLPGIVGSTLFDRLGPNRQVWLTLEDLVEKGVFELLARNPDGTADLYDDHRVEARGLLPLLYDELILGLSVTFGRCVETVPYDWRLDIPSIGKEVALRLQQSLAESPERRLVLVAHSMGGLVAAHAIRSLPEESGKRILGLVALGTPWLGSYEAVLYLRGEGPGFKEFCRLTGREDRRVLEVLQSLRGLVGLLPGEDPVAIGPQLYAPGPLGSTIDGRQALLESARLARTPPPGTFAIVSRSKATIEGIEVAGAALELVEGAGDGVVPFMSATYNKTIPYVEIAGASHSFLPLDPGAIQQVVSKIREWIGKDEQSGGLLERIEADLAEVRALILRERTALLRELSIDPAPEVSLDRLLPWLPLLVGSLGDREVAEDPLP